MKYLFFFLAFFCAQLTFGQLVFENSSKYYGDEFDRMAGNCYCKHFSIDSSLFTPTNIDGYISLKVVDDPEFLWPFWDVLEGKPLLPYKRSENTIVIHREDRKWLKEQIKDSPYLDTIFVLRNRPGFIWYDDQTHEPVKFDWSPNRRSATGKLRSYEETRILMVNDTINFPYFQTVYVEFYQCDGISRNNNRQILCPEKIKVALIEKMNDRLIEMGYLTNEKRRKFLPEVKEALLQFQEDYNLEVGYVDQQTLDYLDINWIVGQ